MAAQSRDQSSRNAETRQTGGMHRRGLGKVGVALPAGVALAQVYAKPDMLSIGTKEVYAASPTGGQGSLDVVLSAQCSVSSSTVSGTIAVTNVSTACVPVNVLTITLHFEEKVGPNWVASSVADVSLAVPSNMKPIGCNANGVGLTATESFSYSNSNFTGKSLRLTVTVTGEEPMSKTGYIDRDTVVCA